VRPFCVWFTGLSASGKTTSARALVEEINRSQCACVLFDGDAVRRAFAPRLGFTDEERARSVQLVGALANDALSEGRVAVCAAVSPFRAGRAECRGLIGTSRFVEVYVRTPLHVCQQRAPKGLYARAARGEVANISGLDAPYEPPLSPEITIETVQSTPDDIVALIMAYLREAGFIEPRGPKPEP